MKEQLYTIFLQNYNSPTWHKVIKKAIRKTGAYYNDVSDFWHLAEAVDQNPENFYELKPLTNGIVNNFEHNF